MAATQSSYDGPQEGDWSIKSEIDRLEQRIKDLKSQLAGKPIPPLASVFPSGWAGTPFLLRQQSKE